ncbi:MAG: ATP-binding cassette domain-containing protein [Fibrobacterales bacterium]
MIHFQHVSKTFDGYRALDDVTLKISKGEFVFLTGSSGAGKTTLLKHIYMQERPDPKGGQVLISYGQDNVYDSKNASLSQVQQFRRKLGIIFQDFKLLTDRSVFDNIAFTLRITGYPSHKIKERVNEVMNYLGITHRRSLHPLALSGGEQQRVAIARAMVHNPSVIVADEPTGNLDPENAQQVFEILKDINAQGTTIVMATHNPGLYEYSTFRRIILDRGRVMNRDMI